MEVKRATFCWEGLGKSDRTRATTAAMAAAMAPALIMVLLMRFHHRSGALCGGLGRRAGGLERRPERPPPRLVIVVSLGNPADEFARTDNAAQIVAETAARHAAVVCGE